VFAVYSTFLQRAIDCVMHDVCLQNLPVVFCVDRAGVVGSDGPTHHGIYDIPMLRCLPNLVMMQPADNAELAAMLKTALAHNGPVTIRYPREPGPDVAVPSVEDAPLLTIGKAQVVVPVQDGKDAVWLWALGDMIPLAQEVAALLTARGVSAGVVNARFIKPLDTALLTEQVVAGARLFVTFENGAAAGGFGSAVAEALATAGLRQPVQIFGWPDAFMAHGTLAQLQEEAGLTAEKIAKSIVI